MIRGEGEVYLGGKERYPSSKSRKQKRGGGKKGYDKKSPVEGTKNPSRILKELMVGFT